MHKSINILVSNDDGIKAEGIRKLTEALAVKGNVYVFAPDEQRSASSHALSIGRPVTLKRECFPSAAGAWSVSGTPADCVKMGLDYLSRQGIRVDIVFAGINHGSNLGTDCMYSGTVSAAAEGAFMGKPAVAVSVDSRTPKWFEGACGIAAGIVDKAVDDTGAVDCHVSGKSSFSVISINTPDIPPEQIKGVIPAYLGRLDYDEWFRVTGEDADEVTYEYTGKIEESDEWTDETDVLLIKKGYATVSMIKYDLNDYEGTEKLKEWGIKLR